MVQNVRPKKERGGGGKTSSMMKPSTSAKPDSPPTAGSGKGAGKVRMCKFHRRGMCSKGEECLFAHDRSELNALNDSPDLLDDDDGGVISREPKDADARRSSPNPLHILMCRTLLVTGSCEDAQCRYAHSRDELQVAPHDFNEGEFDMLDELERTGCSGLTPLSLLIRALCMADNIDQIELGNRELVQAPNVHEMFQQLLPQSNLGGHPGPFFRSTGSLAVPVPASPQRVLPSRLMHSNSTFEWRHSTSG